jgi:hypothetical protein
VLDEAVDLDHRGKKKTTEDTEITERSPQDTETRNRDRRQREIVSAVSGLCVLCPVFSSLLVSVPSVVIS